MHGACAFNLLRQRLEVKFGADLNIARIVPVVDRAKTRAVIHVGIDRHGIAVVEGVEGLETELHAQPLRKSCVLDQRHVPDLQSGSVNCADSGGTEMPDCVCEGSRVEEVRGSFRAADAAADLIGADLNRATGPGHTQTARIEWTRGGSR